MDQATVRIIDAAYQALTEGSSAALMMEYVGHGPAGRRIERAVGKALAAGVGLTGDLHGDGTTTTLTDEIIKHLGA